MIKALRNVDQKKLLFIDIETRAQQEKFDPEVDVQLKGVLEYITRYRKEAVGFDSIEDFYYAKAPLFAELGAICCISVGVLAGSERLRVKSFCSENEKEILEEFHEFLETKVKGFTFCHYAGKNFDEPFILKRMWANNITNIPEMLDNIGEKPWLIKSVDIKELSQANMFYSPSLISMAYMFGIESPKEDIFGGEVNEVFWRGELDRIQKYCERDVLTTANLFMKMTGRETVSLERSEIKSLPLIQRLGEAETINEKDAKEIRKILKGRPKAEQKGIIDIMKGVLVKKGNLKEGRKEMKKVDKIFQELN